MSRKSTLQLMIIAGYHDDKKAFTRLYIESRVSREVADEHFRIGAAKKAGGVKCACPSCNPKN